jgi:murein DD-endopeptidase MepM/ murein hydrolase activator NlpD
MENLRLIISNGLFIDISRDITANEIDSNKLAKEVQTQLVKGGYLGNESDIDGIIGRRTLSAFNRFKKDNDLEYPNILGKTTAEELLNVRENESRFFLPTNGIGWISSPYGMRTLNGRTRMHNGIDIAANRGTQVFSIADGVITNIVDSCREGNFSCGGGFGNWVEVNHPQLNLTSRYCHLDSVNDDDNFRIQSKVKRGQLLGTVGNTGHSFGSHLHFEILRLGQRVNPAEFGRWV